MKLLENITQTTLKWYQHVMNNFWVKLIKWIHLESLNDLEWILNWYIILWNIKFLLLCLNYVLIMINWLF
jgi:hypothetical protein